MARGWHEIAASRPYRLEGLWHPYAARQARRTLLYSAAITGALLVLVLLTDEARSSAAMRLARIAAMSPGAVTLAVTSVMAQARARGEARALATLGVPPLRAALGAIVAGWCICLGAVVVLQGPWVDLRSLFPSAASPLHWIASGPRTMTAPAQHLTVHANGWLELGPLDAVARPHVEKYRGVTLAAFGPIALAAPPWAAARLGVAWRCASLALTAVAMLIGLHAVAGGALSGMWLVLVATPLWAALIGRREHR